MVQPMVTEAIAAAMCTACRDYAHQASLISPFLLAQTYLHRLHQLDNMRPKSSLVVKGLTELFSTFSCSVHSQALSGFRYKSLV